MTDLSELYSRDPLQLTKDDIEELVKSLREKRGQFAIGNMKAGSSKKPTAKQAAVASLTERLGALKL